VRGSGSAFPLTPNPSPPKRGRGEKDKPDSVYECMYHIADEKPPSTAMAAPVT
jgi:hypothetical protein